MAALIRDGGRILICQRPAHKQRPLMWEFPGGKVEEGESHEGALIRECDEELGVILRVGPLYTRVSHIYPDIHIALYLYEAAIASGELTRREHAAFAWIEPGEIPRYDFCPADEDILRLIESKG